MLGGETVGESETPVTNSAEEAKVGQPTFIELGALSSLGLADRVEIEKRSVQGSDGSDRQTKKAIIDVVHLVEQWMHLGAAVGPTLMRTGRQVERVGETGNPQRHDAIDSEVFYKFMNRASRCGCAS